MSNLNYSDYNMTVEWINNIKYKSQSPSINHGVVYSRILNDFYTYIKGSMHKLFPYQTDLCLLNPNETITIDELKKPIVPDLFIVCDNKFELVENSIVCIPDFICEVVSPSSIKLDTKIKKELYLLKGVREYWIVNYLDKTIKVYVDNKEIIYSFTDEVKVTIFNDLTICLKDLELF